MQNESAEFQVMTGFVSVNFKESEDLNTVCARMAGYNAERFEAVALRFYSGDETIITIFAKDKLKEGATAHLPVHKFKVPCSLSDFFREIKQLNFTISNSRYDMWDMEVVNK